MYKDKSICVVVPAYNEEKLIGKTLSTIPEFVDKIIVINDGSSDRTDEIIEDCKMRDSRIIKLEHKKNQGVGSAIATGYKWTRDNNIDITAVMAGDGQMVPDDLFLLLDPIANGETDYAKGNRLFTFGAWSIIPKYRFIGNSVLSLLTKIASGYWHIADSQCGYTAISLKVLQTLDLDKIYKRFGVPNDILVKLNVYGFRVRDIPIKPIYNIGEKSGVRIPKVIFSISWLLVRRFFWRLKEKYIIKDFHPLVFFYSLAMLLFSVSLWLGIRLIVCWANSGSIPKVNALALMFSLIVGFQSLFFAMWFDMEYNKELK